MSRPQTVVFWGAGATADVGFRVTTRQADAIAELAGPGAARPLEARVRKALGDAIPDRWVRAVCDLLAILGDTSDADQPNYPTEIEPEQYAAMRRNWHAQDEEALRQRIVALRTRYDWPGLVDAIKVCPKAPGTPATGSRTFRLNDLFNILDMHQQSGHGFRAGDGHFLAPQRVLGARAALGLLIQTLMYVDWHASCRTSPGIEHHYDFAVALTRRMQREGVRRAGELDEAGLETPEFVRGDVGFVSLNWDPLGIWAQFVANRDLNGDANVPHVGVPARPLWMFHDLGHFVAGPRVNKNHAGSKVWQPMNESSARQLNDPNHGARVRIRVSKYLFPHGSLWWRECPNCGQLSSFIGDAWRMDSDTFLPPPPLRTFADGIDFASWKPDIERDAWDRGEVDARACVHCEELTFAHHMPLLMQTNFKAPPPPFLEDIQREMRVVVQGARHLVLMGYSLPPDDVTYRAFLSARRHRDLREPVRCSVVTCGPDSGSGWAYPGSLGDASGSEAVASAQAVFGPENVRVHCGGFPNVLFDGGTAVTDHGVERLLSWDRA